MLEYFKNRSRMAATGGQWVAAIAGMTVLSLPLFVFGGMVAQRPPQTDLTQPLFRGVTYRRQFRRSPHPVMIHIVTVDLTAPGVRVWVTPGEARAIESEVTARTTSDFLQEFGLQLAINASYFHPFDETTPWEFYPHAGDRVGAVGQAISDGQEYSAPLAGWSVLCISAQARAQILLADRCPPETQQAIAGSHLLVQQGRAIGAARATEKQDYYSRTAVAVDRSGKTLWLLAVDDKQWFYSEGITLAELAEMAIAMGADALLNLDGGGSTTLVMATPSGAKLLNSPAHTKIPMRQRVVATHLGIYAQPWTTSRSPTAVEIDQ